MNTELYEKVQALLAEYHITNGILACDIAILVEQEKLAQLRSDMAIVGA